MRLRKRNAKKGRIEIIPMIDVVFFLLVFSMLSALSMAEINRLATDVPKTGGMGGGDVNRITVNDIHGKLFVTFETPYRTGQKPVKTPAEITPLLLNERQRNPDVAVLVNVEDRASFKEGASIIDAVKGAGVPLVIPAG
ncbi:MAG TPA: biopolymer transporter ExbD [Armatimonadota bacterium]|jgi:biopolymer transport protein ExbD